MSLKPVIIGLLLERPLHGYELKRVLSPALSRERQLNDGVLYPVLARLAREGLIKKRVVPGQGRPDKHVFEPTPKGERWFLAWLAGDAGEADEVTYDFFIAQPFLAKCMFMDRLAPAEARHKIEAQRGSSKAKLDTFLEIRAGMIERNVDPWRIAILDLGIAQQTARLDWIERLLVERTGTATRKKKEQT
jgi:DNA-binding PadR family transcriptional regulator